MKERVQEAVGPKKASEVTMGTFHSVASTFLRKFGSKVRILYYYVIFNIKIGISSSFKIIDESQSLKVIREVLSQQRSNDFEPRELQSRISQV